MMRSEWRLCDYYFLVLGVVGLEVDYVIPFDTVYTYT
jgi:hypothetical protein